MINRLATAQPIVAMRHCRPPFIVTLAAAAALTALAAGAVAAYARTDPPPASASQFERTLHEAICTIRSAA